METSISIRLLTFCQYTLVYFLLSIFLIGGAAAAEPDNEKLKLKLKVATKPFAPFVMLEGDKYTGFSIDLWDAIAKQLKVEYKLNVEYEFLGVETVGELIQTVHDKKADVGIAGISMTAKREEKIDFSHSFFRSGLQIMILNEHESDPSLYLSMLNLGSMILHPKQLQPVIILLMMFFVLGNIIWFLERHHNPSFSPKYFRGIWDGFWWAAVTLTTVGYGDKTPKRFAGQLFGVFVVLIGCVFFASFTAAITAKLTVQHLRQSINGIADLVDKRVATVESSTADYYLQNKRELKKNVVKYGDIDQAYEALKNHQVEAIVYDAPVLQYYKFLEKKPTTKLVGSIFKRENYAIAFPTGSRYKEKVNQILLKLEENGEYEKLREKWFGYL
jgi:polar amino acid transport system substrate-binding protein